MRIQAKDPRLISLMGEFMRAYLPGVRNRDEDTITSYRYSINLFVTYLESEHKVTVMTMQSSDFSQKNIVSFMAWLKSERKNVATTINHRLSDLRGFCKYLYKKNALSLTEYEEIREISDVDDDRMIDFTWLSVNDVYLVLKSTDSNREAIRDRFLLSLLYESGARINEVLSLKLLDIKPTSHGEADVHFYGKGKKHRITPLSKEIGRQYECYCQKYHPDKSQESLVFYTFRNGRQNKMSRDNVSRILEGCQDEVRKSHLHSHLFRRTRAMHLYQAGVPLPTISEWLGHSNIETTRFYYGKKKLVLCQEKVQIKYALLMLSYPAKASALSSNAA